MAGSARESRRSAGGKKTPESERKVSPVKLELLITVVGKDKGAFYADLIQSFDVNIQIVTMAKGTAPAEILHYLGLADTEKAAVFSVVRSDRLDDLLEVLAEKFRTIRGGKGIAMSVPFSSVIGTSVFGFLCNDKRTVKEDAEG